MRGTYSIGKRLLAMLLCIAMVAAYLPGVALVASAAGADACYADVSTMNDWQTLFLDPHTQGVDLTTEYAGGVWTDKSVFPANAIPAELTSAVSLENTRLNVTDTGDNFLVALSAIASNKEIMGYSTIPTDTVFVLDLSSSMRSTDDNRNSAVDELIEATNKAITELLALNKNNRVAVVVYAGNTNKSFSNGQGNVSVVIPLDSYTTNQTANGVGTYLQADPLTVQQGRDQVPNTNPHGLAVYDGVSSTTGGSNAFRNNSFESATGTFMQDGIYEAMKLLNAAEPTVQEGIQAGTTRLPIMVLMTDGESTMGNPDYNGNDARSDLGTSSMYDYEGNTGTYSHRDTMSFVTSLTAAFAKKEIAVHYGTDPLFYTLPYGTAVLNRSEALSVLNPAQASATQNRLWEDFLDGDQVQVYRYRQGNRNQYYTVQNSTVASERLTAEDRMYVDEYFPAENDEAMHQAFEAIVEEIIIQSKYYPTYVERDHDHDGYITFTDKIGGYMDIKSVKGFVIGDHYFSGATLSKGFVVDNSIFGTIDNPNALGDDLVWSVKERLGIESTAVAQALLQDAFDHGQLSYTSDTQFSNYIGWYSDADGNYLDFWFEGADLSRAPAEATHIVKSYGFLGETDAVHGISDTDMLYASVRVSKELNDFDNDGIAGETMLLWQVPASLIPTLTYEVEVTVNSQGEITGVESVELENANVKPIRLLYEIGLQEGIHDWNVEEKVSSGYVNSTDNKDAGYVFYTNQWKKGSTADDAADTNRNTYSHFEPSVQNERYYYTENTPICTDQNGTEYTGSAKPATNGIYYRAFQVFEKMTNGTYRMHTHYERISAAALNDAVQVNGQWYIPKGEVHRYLDDLTVEKTGNEPGGVTHTLNYSNYPTVVSGTNTYYSYSTLGNNGKLLYTPATGIKLTKNLAEGFTSTERFTFTISGGDLSDAQVVWLDDQGDEASRTDLAANGEVTLAAGETVYIIGLAAGTYTVSEDTDNKDYKVSLLTVDDVEVAGTQAVVTLADQDITDVKFTNDAKGHGSLVLGKDVQYPDGFVPTAAHDSKSFTVEVKFTGDTTGMVLPGGAQLKTGTTDTYVLFLSDYVSATFSNIPEGVTYEVTETALSAGYTNVAINYSDATKTIDANAPDEVHVINSYTPASVSPNVVVRGDKTMVGAWPAGAEFTVGLYMVTDFASGDATATGLTDTITQADPDYEIDMSSLSFDKEGIYYFRVIEEIPATRIPNMAYDQTYGLFSITVVDEDADGYLEIKEVNRYQNTGLSGDAQNGWVITKDFTNVVTTGIVRLPVEKHVVDSQGTHYPDIRANITFGLFESLSATAPSYYMVTNSDGKATITVPVTKDGLGTGKTYYLREIAPAVANRVVGMTYDETWKYAITITWDDVNNVPVVNWVSTDASGNATGSSTLFDPTDTTFAFEITNTYTSGIESAPEILISGVKTLNGDNDLGGRKFSFSIYHADAAFAIQGSAIETVENDGNVIEFGGITYDTPGVKHLVVKENASSLGGVTIDGAEYHITVLVEKAVQDGMTVLKVADGYPIITKFGVSGTIGTNAVNFDNTYTITGDTSVTITGTKSLTGRPMLNGEFRFSLVEVANAKGDALTGGLELQAVNGPASGNTANIRFAPITYTEVGTHYYKISEVKGAQNTGITYSNASHIVRVDVTDNNVGGLAAEWLIVDENDVPITNASIAFANIYTPADVTLQLTGLKSLEDKEIADYTFDFSIVQTNSSYQPLAGSAPQIVHNSTNGVITFPKLTYTADDAGNDFYYLVEEVAGDMAYIRYDDSVFHIHVKVIDDGMGSLKTETQIVKVVADDSTDPAGTLKFVVSSMTFYNRYQITEGAQVTLEGAKILTGRPTALQADEFTFELYADETDYPTTGTPWTVKNDANGGFSLTLDYGPEDAGKTYYYVLKEQAGDKSYITYSTAEYRFQVLLEDNGVGGIKATVTSEDSLTMQNNGTAAAKVTGFAFENIYKAAPVDYPLEVQKIYEGDTMKTFDFVLSGNGFATQTKQNDDQGKVVFDKLTFASVGSYTFTVKEKENILWGFIKWDTNKYELTIKVTDNGLGQLEIGNVTITSTKGRNDLVFRNVHEDLITKKDVALESKPDISIDGQKVQAGDVLVYTITYTNYTGTVLDEVTITDTIPQHTEFVTGSAGSGTLSGNQLSWKFTGVAVDAVITVNFKVKVTEGGVTVTNKATVLEGANTYETNEVTNPVEKKDPALAIVKEQVVGNGKATTEKLDAEIGNTVTYFLTVTNSGEGEAKGITVSDKIPEGLVYVASSANNGGTLENGVITWQIPSLAAGQSVELQFQVKIPTVTKDTSWNNVATVVYENNPDGNKSIESNEVVVAAKIPVTPDTGDNFSATLFITLMILSSFGIAAIMVCKKREEETT